MSNFIFCASCLITGVNMQSFRTMNSSRTISETFHKLLEISTGVHHKHICFECARLVFKYEEFRSKCHRAQVILSAISALKDEQDLFKNLLIIDRKQNGLNSNLSLSQTETYDNQTQIEYSEANSDVNNEAQESYVKDEIPDEIHDLDDGLSYHNHDTKRKKKRHGFKRKRNIKQKEKIDDSLSDDEPLATKLLKSPEKEIKEIGKTVPECSKLSKNHKNIDYFEDYATIMYLTPDDAKKELLLRKESTNYLNSPMKCELCYRGYEMKAAFDNHMNKHSKEYGDYVCDICKLRFPEQRYLCKHRLASHKRKFCCKICPYVCFCMHQAKTHVSLHKGKKYPCKECGEIFSLPNSLLMHKRQKHSTECVCALCGHTFATTKGLTSHTMKLHRQHINEKLGPKCDECNTHFSTEAAWKLHLVLSSKHNVSNGCKSCGETFPCALDLKVHARSHARSLARTAPQLPATCTMCGKWLTTDAEYTSHMTTSHAQSGLATKLKQHKHFVCEVCGQMFKKQCFLTYHQRKHSGERPYKCSECDKSFLLAGALSTHRAVHLERGAFKCALCGRVFAFKSGLNKHMKVHLGIRPHRCDICEKAFISPCDVKAHIKYVHNKVPWPKRDKKREHSFVQ